MMVKPNRLGQAVLEFAIFASFLLLCTGVFIQTGMYTLLSDNTRMTAFRQSFILAKQAGAMASSTNPSLSVLTIQDKYIPSLSGYFGAADAVQLTASANPVISTRLRTMPGGAAFTSHSGLPVVRMNINGTVKQYNLADYSFINNTLPSAFPFRVKEDVPDPANTSGPWWRWACNGSCYANSKDTSGNFYIQIGSLVWVDDDNDSLPETPLKILDLERSPGCQSSSGNCFFVRMAFLDYTQGDINSYAQATSPTSGLNESQGLQSIYKKERASSTTVRRLETPSRIRNYGDIDHQIKVKRTVKLNKKNNGRSNEIVSQVNQRILEYFLPP